MSNTNFSAQKRFPVVDGKISIELKLKSPHQLFDERDPAPFRERDLEDEAVRYIVSSYKELPSKERVQLSLYFANLGDFANNPTVIENAIHTYFQYEAELKRRDLKNLFKQGLISLAIGLTFLVICSYSTFNFKDHTTGDFWRTFMHEGLMLMGWVSMWRPISTFLYEWWPMYGELKTLERLGGVDVMIEPLEKAALRESALESAPTHRIPFANLKTS